MSAAAVEMNGNRAGRLADASAGLAMKAGTDGYNQRSAAQQRMGRVLIERFPLVVQHLQRLLPAGDASLHLSVLDCGCSQGGQSRAYVEALVAAINRQRGTTLPSLSVHAYLNDTADNDWRTVGQIMTTTSCALAATENCHFTYSSIDRSLFGRLLPPRSVALVVSSQAMHWLTDVPRTPNLFQLWPRCLEEEAVTAAMHAAALRDFRAFLRHRAAEVMPGGCLAFNVLVGEFPIADVLTDTAHDMVRDGAMPAAVVSDHTVPFFLLSFDVRMAEIEAQTGKWEVVRAERLREPSLYWAQYKESLAAGVDARAAAAQLADRFVDDYLVGVMQPMLLGWVAAHVAGPGGAASAIVDAYFDRVKSKLTEAPVEHVLDFMVAILRRR